jgi:DNA uptake protein ComE-like DNA-binding protein
MGLTRIAGMLLAAIVALPAIAAVPASAVAPASSAASASPFASPAMPPGHAPIAAGQRKRPAVVEHYVDINSAGRAELMTLPGIGSAEADKIVANRPYLTKTELVTKNVLPVGPYMSLKNLVVAMPKAKPKGKP